MKRFILLTIAFSTCFFVGNHASEQLTNESIQATYLTDNFLALNPGL